MPDALELETLALAYRERYGIDLILLWHDDMMLGDLFAIAHPVAALPLRRSSLANAIEIYRYKTVIALAFAFMPQNHSSVVRLPWQACGIGRFIYQPPHPAPISFGASASSRSTSPGPVPK